MMVIKELQEIKGASIAYYSVEFDCQWSQVKEDEEEIEYEKAEYAN